MVVLPTFAGTNLNVIASNSIADPSYYITHRLPMTLLTMDEVFSFVESNAEHGRLLRQSQICRDLFFLGGVPRWVVDYLLELESRTQSDVVPLKIINACFNEI